MAAMADQFLPGQRVQITTQIPQRSRVWTSQITGIVLRYEQRKTGSWYAHAKDGKLWLDRLVIKREDGEIVMCNLDQYTRVELLDESVGSVS